jgi:hypothetical protein
MDTPIRKYPPIIGFHGAIGAGKDTFANLIHQKLMQEGHFAVVRRFADPLKDVVATFLNVSRKTLEDRNFKETPIEYFNNFTPRDLLIQFGDSMKSFLSHDVFVKCMARFYEQEVFENVILIPDVRYVNELRWIEDQRGIVVHIDREDNPFLKSSDHSSENELADYPFAIKAQNDCTLEELPESMDVLLHAIRGFVN